LDIIGAVMFCKNTDEVTILICRNKLS